MGIPGVKSLIHNKGKSTNLRNYNGMVVAIDASLYIYKYGYRYLLGFFYKSCMLLNHGILPLWVFDGPPPIIKNETIMRRRKKRVRARVKLKNTKLTKNQEIQLKKQAFGINSKIIEDIKNLLQFMGLPFVQSPGEADAQCAALNKSGLASIVMSNDWDIFLFGGKSILVDDKNELTQINISDILKTLNINKDQLIDLAILLGTDYCKGVNCESATNVLERFRECNFNIGKYDSVSNEFLINWKQARDYYINAPVVNPKKVNTTWKQPQCGKIYQCLHNTKNFNKTHIQKKINELNFLYNQYINESKNTTRITNNIYYTLSLIE